MSTDVVRAVIWMHGGVKHYRGKAKAARNYVEMDCARYDDYYLAEGDGIAMRFVAETTAAGDVALEKKPAMNGETYEGWVAGILVETRQPKERLRTDAKNLVARGCAPSGGSGGARRRPGARREPASDAWLFTVGDGPMYDNDIDWRWHASRSSAGPPHVRLHDLRPFYASGLIAAGCDVVTVQRALGTPRRPRR